MKDKKTVYDQVKEILEDYPDARENYTIGYSTMRETSFTY